MHILSQDTPTHNIITNRQNAHAKAQGSVLNVPLSGLCCCCLHPTRRNATNSSICCLTSSSRQRVNMFTKVKINVAKAASGHSRIVSECCFSNQQPVSSMAKRSEVPQRCLDTKFAACDHRWSGWEEAAADVQQAIYFASRIT